MSFNRKITAWALGGVVVLFLASTMSAQGTVTKIKVIVENAAIRLNPSLDSEALEENIELGKVFTVEKKAGEWFEVKTQSQLGVTLVGYIHEMYVEVVTEAEAPPEPEAEPEPAQPERQAPPPVAPGPMGIRFGLRLGGMFAALQPGYDWETSFLYAGEDYTIRDSLANGSGFGFEAELGVFVIPFLEVTAGFGLASKGLTGTYGLGVPNIYLWNDIAEDTQTAPVNYKATFISFGLNFYPMPEGRFSPFIGLGGCSVSATLDLMEDISYTDTYSLPSYRHTIDIEEIMQSEEKLSKFGFYFRGGFKFLATPNIYVFAQGKYVLARVTVEHLLSAFLDDLEALDINLGGFFAGLGLGVVF